MNDTQKIADRILELIEDDGFLEIVPTFSELHEYVDANMYVVEALEEFGIKWSAASQDDMDMINEIDDLVDVAMRERAGR